MSDPLPPIDTYAAPQMAVVTFPATYDPIFITTKAGTGGNFSFVRGRSAARRRRH